MLLFLRFSCVLFTLALVSRGVLSASINSVANNSPQEEDNGLADSATHTDQVDSNEDDDDNVASSESLPFLKREARAAARRSESTDDLNKQMKHLLDDLNGMSDDELELKALQIIDKAMKMKKSGQGFGVSVGNGHNMQRFQDSPALRGKMRHIYIGRK